MLIADEQILDTFEQLTLFDGSKEHYVTPHTGTRWSLVLFEHNKVNLLSAEQRFQLSGMGFCMTAHGVSDVEPTTFTEDAQVFLPPEERHKVIALEWTSSLLPMTCTLGILKYKGISLVVSSDSELIEMLPKIKSNNSIRGSTLGGRIQEFGQRNARDHRHGPDNFRGFLQVGT
jgi:hypothetical protein